MEHALNPGGLGIFALLTLLAALLTVMTEGTLHHMRKSKPVLLAAIVIWGLLAINGNVDVEAEFGHDFGEVAQLVFFLIVAVTFVNVLDDRGIFAVIRSRLERSGFSLRSMFWITGGLAFCISPVADNMTTALIMGTVVMSVGGRNAAFVAAGCVNVVVAANAGGAFSPFGDITTLMVWRDGVLPFGTFFHLMPAALVTWFIPALLMSFGISSEPGQVSQAEPAKLKPGALVVTALFAGTIALSVTGHNYLHLPAVWGMLGGLAILNLYGYFLRMRAVEDDPFDVYAHVTNLDWDTLKFFVGVIMAVAGIGHFGYLEVASAWAYGSWDNVPSEVGTAMTNAGIGVVSAFIDNIPLMFAVLEMRPDMSAWQWLLITLAAGVGGSLLSIGSAAGVALMGKASGVYTFRSHLRYTPLVAIGYVAGIGAHYGYAALFASYLFG